jgi:UDP-GlcNAc3NAcA epimerase
MVSRALRSLPDVQNITLHTGQHYDSEMSQVFFTELGIPDPDYNLAIGSGTHGRQTGRMLEAIEAVLSREQPDWVVVFGDTNSTLAGALAAAKLHMPLAHVEAGLRSFNRRMPEEINRILTDHASDLLFAPTTLARENLSREGIGSDKARLVGDVMYDAALCYGKLAEEHSTVLARLNLKSKGYILATVHRAENTNDPDRLGAILTDLNGLETGMPVIFPIHPRTRQILQRYNGFIGAGETIRIIEPLGYLYDNVGATCANNRHRLGGSSKGGLFLFGSLRDSSG